MESRQNSNNDNLSNLQIYESQPDCVKFNSEMASSNHNGTSSRFVSFNLPPSSENWATNSPMFTSSSEVWASSCHEAQQQNTRNELKSTGACIGLGMPTLSAATAKRALKSGADKLCCTVNTVRTKFGTLSQKLRKSTRRRNPLVNSPETPCRTPRAALGRTPTKLYSPFSIDTPRGKENSSARRSLNRESFKKVTPPRGVGFSVRRRMQVEDLPALRTSPRLNSDMQQAQIGVYEFHHTADHILRNFRQ